MPPRADAAENRARIVQAARDQLSVATDVGDVRLNEVARAAGVGQGTLYRHFPTRDALVLEVYRAEVDEMCDEAAELVHDLPAAEALERWLERLSAYAWVKQGVFAVVEAATRASASEHSRHRITEAVDLLLDAGRRAGSVRPDVDARDLVLLVGYLSRLGPDERGVRDARLRAVVLHGLRPAES